MKLRFIAPLALAAMAAVWPSDTYAAPVSPEQALAIAAQARGSLSDARKAPAVVSPSIVLTRGAKGLETALYAVDYGQGNGFAIVAGDDSAPAILGFADSGSLDPSNLPPALEALMNNYSLMVAKAAEGGAPYDPVRVPGRNEIEPLVKSTWNQMAPYNDYCPRTGANRAPVGCVALSTGQVMRTHQWPPKSRGTVVYDAGRFRLNTEYDWASMPDSGLGLTSEQTDNMAKMLYELARSLYMTFTGVSSGTYSYYTAESLINYFAYDTSADYLNRNFFTDSQWEEIVYAQLASGQAMPYDGMAISEGHSFVCDGYRDGYFHINWGWEGKSDGYFLLNNLDPVEQGVGGTDSGFFRRHGVVTNIRRPQGGIQPMRINMTGELQQGELPGTFRVGDYDFDGWGIEEGFFNLTSRDFTSALGLRAVSVSDPSDVSYFFEAPREWVRWFTRAPFIKVDISSLPDGRYYIYPVHQDEFGRISDIACSTSRTNVLEVTMVDGKYTVAKPSKVGGAPVAVVGGSSSEARDADPDLRLQPGFFENVHAYVQPLDADAELEWSSSDNSVAVALDGMVISRGKIGTAVITASVKGNPSLSTSFLVEVEKPVIIESLSFAKEKEYVLPGEQIQLDPLFAPAKVSNSHLKFTSSDENIATVDSNGLVTASSNEGAVKITATTLDGSELEAVCTVEVTKDNSVDGVLDGEIFNGPSPVFSATGIKVCEASDASDLDKLPAGLYIWRGTKHLIAR